METCFYIAECSLSYAKIRYSYDLAKFAGQFLQPAVNFCILSLS